MSERVVYVEYEFGRSTGFRGAVVTCAIEQVKLWHGAPYVYLKPALYQKSAKWISVEELKSLPGGQRAWERLSQQRTRKTTRSQWWKTSRQYRRATQTIVYKLQV